MYPKCISIHIYQLIITLRYYYFNRAALQRFFALFHNLSNTLSSGRHKRTQNKKQISWNENMKEIFLGNFNLASYKDNHCIILIITSITI